MQGDEMKYPHFLIHIALGAFIDALMLWPLNLIIPFSIWIALAIGAAQGGVLDLAKKWRPDWHVAPPWWTFPGGHAHAIYDLWLHRWTDWWAHAWAVEFGLWVVSVNGIVAMFKLW
jgi:hypothetical protein